jgi:uncharacterized protein (TIGR03437 family)
VRTQGCTKFGQTTVLNGRLAEGKIMQWFKAFILVVFTSVILCSLIFNQRVLPSVQAKISPGPPLAMTGAPEEGTCIGCHYTYGGADSVPNLGPGRVQITGLPAHYTFGQSYAVTVTVTANEASTRRWGFELTALTANDSSATAGELVVTDALRVLKRSGSVLDKARVYLSHNDEDGTSLGRTGANNWKFDWIAPSSSAGEISFYAAGNAADGQVTPEGDYIYTTLATVKPPVPIVAGQALIGLSSYLSAVNATQVELRARGNVGAGAKLVLNNVELPTQTVDDGLFATLSASQLGSRGALTVRVRLGNGELSNALSFVVASNINNKAVVAVDAAAYSLAVTPGQIVALFGSELTNNNAAASAITLPLPRVLQNTTIYVNGVAAPLFFASNGQINFQVPYSTATGLASIVVLREDGMAAQGFINVYPTAPALFAANAAGKGQAAALNEDFSSNSSTRRAKKGSSVILFGTGTGAQLVNGNGQAVGLNDGEASTGNLLIVTADRPTVMIGGRAANVAFSGLSPGLVGLWQLNVQIPNDAPSGSGIEVLVKLGKRSANLVTLAIE